MLTMLTLVAALGVADQGEIRSFVPTLLVRAKAISINRKDDPGKRNMQTTVFTIEHVFSGDRSLEGKTFQLECAIEAPVSSDAAYRVEPPPKKGEVGIWWLMIDAKTKRPVVDWYCDDWSMSAPVPAREGLDPSFSFDQPYKDTAKWAEAVEKVYHADANARVKLLKGYCSSDNRFIPGWATMLLLRNKVGGLEGFFQGLLNDQKLSVWGRCAADTALVQLEGKNWRQSKKRYEMLRKLATGELNKDEARAVAYWIAGDKELDYGVCLEFVKLGLNNDKAPPEFTSHLLNAVGQYRGAKNEDLEFDFMVELLTRGKSDEVRAFAAARLGTVVVLTKKRLARLQALRKKLDAKEFQKVTSRRLANLSA